MKILAYIDGIIGSLVMMVYVIINARTISPLFIFLLSAILVYYLAKVNSMFDSADIKKGTIKNVDDVVVIPIWKMIRDDIKHPSLYRHTFYGMITKWESSHDLLIKLYLYTLTGNVVWWIYLFLKWSYKSIKPKAICSRIKRYIKSDFNSVSNYNRFLDDHK